MSAKTRAKDVEQVIEVPTPTLRRIELAVVGTSPLILNCMSEKSRRDVLVPPARKTAAARASSLKHNPLEEFANSIYRMPDDAPTLIGMPATALKSALMTAALDVPGVVKAKVGRLVFIEGHLLPVWGVPKLFMAVVRSADQNRTPDVRTRAILPQWMSVLRASFIPPLINETVLVNLLATAGITVGIGDWRPEKGKGAFGQFKVLSIDDLEVTTLMACAGRDAQIEALHHPEPFDHESATLLSWFKEEIARRGINPQAQ